MTRIFVAVLLLALVSPAAAQQAPVAPPSTVSPAVTQSQSSRPRIGLALGGGAARGIAHIGLLRWFEEHRIPVDYLAGTSMGGLIGGAYASGMTPDEIQDLMQTTDWDVMFLADAPFRYKTFRRKEDARSYPSTIDFGLKGGFKLPTGLNAGQQIELLLDRIALPYYELRDFDALPTPFRSVATDIRQGESLVIGSGPFARALRATMAIPGVFTPVSVGEQLLVDGGTLNNVPADVVKGMGADVTIAVNVSSSTDGLAPPNTLFSVLGQTLDSMMTTATRQALKSADIVIVPDLKGLTGGDWRRTQALVDQGYKAAEDMAAQLLKYQVDEATHVAFQAARQARRRTTTPPVTRVLVEGLPEGEGSRIEARLAERHLGQTVDRDGIEDSVLRIAGTERYETAAYFLRDTPTGIELVVRITPKDYGPPFLLPAIDLQNIDSNSFSLGLRARLAIYDSPISHSEVRVDAGVGSDQSIGVELYKLLGHRGFFVAPRAYFSQHTINAYSDEDLLAEYRSRRTGYGFDVGHTTGMRTELRLGYDMADVRAKRRIGEPVLPEARGTDSVASLRWEFDGQDSSMVPGSGARVRTAYRYFFQTPDATTETGELLLSGPKDVSQGEVVASWAKRIWSRQRLLLAGSVGTSFGDNPGFNEFRLGGPLRLGSYNNDEIVGANYFLATAGLLHEWFRLPDVLGGNAYIGAWVEQGDAFDEWGAIDYKATGSAGVMLETIFGPLFAGYSQSLTSGGGRFYISLGPLLR